MGRPKKRYERASSKKLSYIENNIAKVKEQIDNEINDMIDAYLEEDEDGLKEYEEEQEKMFGKEICRIASKMNISPLKVYELLLEQENTLNSTLNDMHILMIMPIFNKYILLKEQSVLEIKAIFECSNYTSYLTKNNRLLSYLFNLLSKEKYICSDWQHQLEIHKTFTSKNGKILKAYDFAKALNQIKNYGEPKHSDIIDKLINELKNIENKNRV
jgi:hypothetical protein